MSIERHDQISPYRWPEILSKFPLDYARAIRVNRDQIPPGRLLRDLDDKAAQYGDLLQHDTAYVVIPANVIFFSGCSSSGTSYTMAGTISTGTSQINFPPTASATGLP